MVAISRSARGSTARAACSSVNGGGEVDHIGGSIVGLRLSTFRGNVRLSVQQKCHLSNPGSYQMSTAPVVRFAAALDKLTSQTAVWYRSGKPPVPLHWVLVRDPQGEFATQALLCTDLAVEPAQILEWFVLRWQLEVTFQEVRAHLGMETQRQWSDLSISRTTPVLLGLFSWTTLAAHSLQKQHSMTQRTAAWYDKPSPTFVDAIALVRRHLWLASEGFSRSAGNSDTQELPIALYHRLVDSLAYAA